MKKLLDSSIMLVLSMLFAHSLSSQTVVSFTNPIPAAPTLCTDTWSENGIPQSFDQVGSCSFDYSSGDLWLFPASMIADLSVASMIDSIQIDFIDWCGLGCTYAKFISGGVVIDSIPNATSSTPETMVFHNTGANAMDAMIISSFEGQFMEIRIYPEIPSSVCPAKADICAEQGDVYVEDSCHGVILKSPNGSCYRIRVDDNGALLTESVDCPN